MTLSEELQWRGFVNQTTYKDIKVLDNEKIKFYFGVDPSADSMTIGNLASMMMVKAFVKHGHDAVLLVGGATGMIGDPDGKKQERDLLSLEQIAKNKQAIAGQYSTVLEGENFQLVDNYDWFKDIRFLDFLREVGKHVPMRQMVNREFVQSRLSEGGSGISYAEFSYSLIQGYDFLHLNKELGVTLQLCGADQWGNSIAGVDLTRRISGNEVHVWSTPLVVNKSTGKKFGKTEEGAVWLASDKTSPFKYYQFWINLDDEGVEEYLKIYTDLDKETIDSVMNEHGQDQSKRTAQKKLAFETTKNIHGQNKAESVVKISEVLFGDSDYNNLSSGDFEELKNELVCVNNSQEGIAGLLVDTGLASSKGEARRFLDSNAIYINGSQIPLEKKELNDEDFIDGYCVIRRGKNATALVQK